VEAQLSGGLLSAFGFPSAIRHKPDTGTSENAVMAKFAECFFIYLLSLLLFGLFRSALLQSWFPSGCVPLGLGDQSPHLPEAFDTLRAGLSWGVQE
jgi:hypothetical protein